MIPNLPTDNLYMFIALSGFAFIGFVIYMEVTTLRELEDKQYSLTVEVSKSAIEAEAILEKSKKLDKIISGSIASQQENSKNNNDKYALYYSNEEVKQFIDDLDIETAQLKLKRVEHELAIKHLDSLVVQLNSLRFLWNCISTSALIISMLGFVLWYFLVQRHLDRKIRGLIFAILQI